MAAAIGIHAGQLRKAKCPSSTGILATQCNDLPPATVDREDTGTTLGYPDSSAVRSVGTAFNARRIGSLATQVSAPRTTQVHCTEVVTVIIAGARNVKALVPARRWIPATVATMGTTIGTTRFGETTSAAAVDPDATTINTPVVATPARRRRNLPNQPRITPIHAAMLAPIILTTALDYLPGILAISVTLRVHRLSGNTAQRQQQ